MIEIRRALVEDAEAVADVYINSFRAALPTVHPAHSDDEVRSWIRTHLIPEAECWVAVDSQAIVAVLALKPGWVDQLYVAPDRLGEGIGRLLLNLAKERSGGRLHLWTFQVNTRARRFYENYGFTAIELTNGAANEEREPDIRYEWSRSRPQAVTR